MGLIAKFAILASLLSAAVAVNIVAVVWSIGMLERELSWPLDSMQTTLGSLHEIRSELIALEREGRRGTLDPGTTRDRLSRSVERLTELEDSFPVQMRIGIGASHNLRARLEEARRLTDAWPRGDTRARDALVDSFAAMITLLDRVERRVIEDAALAVDFGSRLRARVLGAIVISALLTLATIGLSAVFVRRWVLAQVEQLRDGAMRLAAGDLDHRVRIDTGDQLGRLAADFNTMASTIDSLQKERIERERLAAMGEMLRRVVHNLRTPLTGIRALAESSRQEVPESGEVGQMQGRIIASVDRFEGWLRDLLEASSPLRVQPGPVSPEPWIRGVIESRADAASSRGVSIELRIGPGVPERVEIDAEQMARAAEAVLDNALDVSPRGGVVGVTLSCSERAGWWTIEFSDEGGGIDPGDLGRIFEPPFTTKRGGTGIGLAMTKSIVDAHSGRIDVRTCPPKTQQRPGEGPGAGVVAGVGGGHGTCFRFELPIERRKSVANTGH